MSDLKMTILCCAILAAVTLVIDFDAANDRWCKTYPESILCAKGN
jgi:uncharacterized YccA/Bax inhibitor family protein